jgi:hypothetical protein
MRLFSAALAVVSPSLNVNAIVSAISSSVAPLQPSETEEMVAAVISLYAAMESADFTSEGFIEEICSAMDQSGRKDLNFENDRDRGRFKNRLVDLLNIESFSLASKALSLKSECDHLFCTARIMTDARPVYGADVSTAPHAALILHSVRLSFHEESTDIKDFYITLDDSDIRELRELLDRAESKSKSLTAALKAAGIHVVSTENSAG